MGDFQEDRQLQRAVKELFEAQGAPGGSRVRRDFEVEEDDDDALPVAMLTGARMDGARRTARPAESKRGLTPRARGSGLLEPGG